MVPYYSEQLDKTHIVEIPLISDDNGKIISTPFSVPSFYIYPNNEIYPVLDKMDNIFIDDVKRIFNLIEDPTYFDNERHEKLLSDLDRITKEGKVNSLDVATYYNLDNALISSGEYNEYSKDVVDNIITLIKGKLIIDDFHLDLLKTNTPDLVLKDWERKKGKNNYRDFLIQSIGFSEIKKDYNDFLTITTSRLYVNEEYFNYQIMNYNIDSLPKYVVGDDKKTFSMLSNTWYLLESEIELEKDIKRIRKTIPFEERYKEFK